MAENVRSFRKYLEELSGNNFLGKKIKSLERANLKLEGELADLKADIKLLKKSKAVVIPKKRGKKPRPMIQLVEDEMAKKKDKTMRVTEIVKILKKKRGKLKSRNLYSSVATSMSKNPKFEKTGVGEFRLTGAVKKKAAKKASK